MILQKFFETSCDLVENSAELYLTWINTVRECITAIGSRRLPLNCKPDHGTEGTEATDYFMTSPNNTNLIFGRFWILVTWTNREDSGEPLCLHSLTRDFTVRNDGTSDLIQKIYLKCFMPIFVNVIPSWVYITRTFVVWNGSVDCLR